MPRAERTYAVSYALLYHTRGHPWRLSSGWVQGEHTADDAIDGERRLCDDLLYGPLVTTLVCRADDAERVLVVLNGGS